MFYYFYLIRWNTLIFGCLELQNRLEKELLLKSSSGASVTGALQHGKDHSKARQPGCCFLSDLVILGTADKPFVHLGTTELKNKRGVKSRELKAGLSSAGCGAALMGPGEELCSQGIIITGLALTSPVGWIFTGSPRSPPRLLAFPLQSRREEAPNSIILLIKTRH